MPTLCTGGIGIPIQFVAWQDLDAADYLFLNSEPAREYMFTWHPYVVLFNDSWAQRCVGRISGV